MRKVGTESSKSWEQKKQSGFFTKYMNGFGLEVGGRGYQQEVPEPILDTAISVDLGYPGYNGIILPFPSDSFDYVYSSHVLEHIESRANVIREWHRVLKVGGHLVIVVPHQFLYEKKASRPSKWNGDHKIFYTPGVLLTEIEHALTPNSYRVRLVRDEDEGFDYTIHPENHSVGCYEMTLVLEKINLPTWSLA